MRAFVEIFKLEFLAFARSRALAMLSVASLAWMLVAPYIFRSDGTDEGAREVCVRFSLGGVATLLAVALLVTAAGALSRERAAKRLQLTMVRPVRLFSLAIAKMLALTLAGAIVLALAAGVEAIRQDAARPCSSVYRPIMPSPAEEAAQMYESYIKDPETPKAVKQAKKSLVLRILTQRAIDRYETINTNETATWNFPLASSDYDYATTSCTMRFRFSNLYNMRDDVRGVISGNGYRAVVSNISQAVIQVPLKRHDLRREAPTSVMHFANHGRRAVMLRPRRDVELLVEADGFLANLGRAYLQLVALLALLVAFGVFLGACLSRPVAVFVAVVVLALSEMSPSVVEQYPSEFEASRSDAIGLAIARFSTAVTHPISSLHPLTHIAADERIEPRDVARTLLTHAVALPMLFALLAAFLLPRKQDEL